MGETRTWLRASWRTGLVLALIIALAFFLRTYFAWGLWYPAGFFSGKGDYSGGSDPFYWERAMFYSLQTGKEISIDMAMNYPLGFPDVRPPLFTWFNLLAGYILSPFFGSVQDASVFMLMMNAALFGTLALIPTYLIGKEAFGRRTGIFAALLLAISAAALQRSHATIAVHDSWTLFFVVCAFYFYLRALKTLDRKRWVENWFSGTSVRTGLRLFFKENRKSVLYGLLAGMSVAVTALSWQGWAYVPVILVLIFLVELILDRIRNQDAMGVTVIFALILGTPLLVSFPWYFVRNLIRTWWDVPFYLFAVALILGIVFAVTRDYPWTIVIPATFIAGGAGLLVGFTVNPSLLFAFYSGAGYFVKNKVYQTIAEAQEPGLSELILSYGWFTYFIGLAAVAWMLWQMPRRNNPAFTMMVFWTVGSLFMAIAAARFIFNAAPPFAIATGWALDLILLRMDFGGMKRTYRSLAEGSRRNAFRKSVKVRHVLTALFLVFLVLLPNVWFAVDSAIPFETKSSYDAQINSMLPSFLRAPGYKPSSGTFYLGAFGYTLPKPTDYFPAAWSWLDTQDANVPLEDRPAFMSWWDYGFEATERGGHPVVADPFQNGYWIAGQFILAQNESSAVGILALRILEGDFRSHTPNNFSPATAAVLRNYGLPVDTMLAAYRNPTALIPVVLGNPTLYGVWDSNLQFYNALYIYLDTILVTHLTEDQIASLYHDLRPTTGFDIGYFMVDTRLFPISATNTGIFYAPAKLSDHRVLTLSNGQVIPTDFFQIFANTQNAQGLPIQLVQPTDTIQSESIQYQKMFYDSMFYRAYVGYSPTDLGYANDTGIPGFDTTLQSYAPEPAWNLTHFRLVYRTSYYNPYTDASNHTSAWQAISHEEALALQKKIQAGTATGTVDLSTQATVQNGLVMLRYYDGAYVNGTVTTGGSPVPGAWVTVTDELGTPHGVTKTDAQGHYSLLAPFGNITITVSTGSLTRTTLVASNVLATTTFPVSMDQAMRVNEDLDGNGIPDWLITKDVAVQPVQVHGTVFFDLNHDGSLSTGDYLLAGATVHILSQDLHFTLNATANARGVYTTPAIPQGIYNVSVTYRGHTLNLRPFSFSTSLTSAEDLPVAFASISGLAQNPSGAPLPGAALRIEDATNGTAWTAQAAANGTFRVSPLMYGDYHVTVRSGILASLSQLETLSSANSGPYLNLTLTPSGWLAGATKVMGVRTPHATLQFQSQSDTSLVVTATSDETGAYNVSLPEGTWNVNGRAYVNGQLYAYLAQVDVPAGSTRALSPSFQAGIRVTGTISAPSVSSGTRPTLAFFGVSGEWWVRGGAGGTYVAYLPQGSYDLQASAQDFATRVSYAYVASANLQYSRTLNVPLWTGTEVTGTVYWDTNGNGVVDSGEGIRGARLSLQDELGNPMVATTNATGVFTFIGFSNRTYSGGVSAPGFSTTSVGPTILESLGSDARFALTPVPVAVVGRVLLNGTVLLNRPLTVRAVASSDSARDANTTVQSDGSYSLNLVPGDYRLVVDENATAGNASRYQNLGTDDLNLTVGQVLVDHELAIAYRVAVKGNVTLSRTGSPATVTFTGPDVRTVQATSSGYSVYLQPGAYVVSATRTVTSSVYEVVVNATVPVGGNLSLAMTPAIQVTGQLRYNGGPLAVSAGIAFARLEGGSFSAESGTGGSYSTYLVPGNYSVTVNATSSVAEGTFVRFYRYTFGGDLTLAASPTAVAYDLDVARNLDNATLSGSVRFNGIGVDATLVFQGAGLGAINATVAVPSDGTYSVGLAPGAYVVYAAATVNRGAFLGAISVPHVETLALDVGLSPAFSLSGTVTDATGARAAANLRFQGNATYYLPTDSSGGYGLLLPVGAYSVSANKTGSEQGVLVIYSASDDLNLTSDSVANLQLAKVIRRGVAILWDPSQNRTIAPGGSVTYSFAVRNTGDVADTYALSGQASGWSFAFSPSIVSLNFGTGGSAASVSVTITSPADALVNHAAVTVVATSQTDSTVTISQVLTVGIQRTRAISVAVDTATATYDGRYLNYTVNLRNSGNAPETVDVSVTNPGDLATSGWVAGLANRTASAFGGTTLLAVTLPANGTTAIRLSLRNVGGASGASVVVQAAAEDNPSVSAGTVLALQLPSLSTTTGIGVAGPSDAKTLPENLLLIAAIVGAIAAAGTALALSRRRR